MGSNFLATSTYRPCDFGELTLSVNRRQRTCLPHTAALRTERVNAYEA